MSVLYNQYEKCSYIQFEKFQLIIDDVLDTSQKQGDSYMREMGKTSFEIYLENFLQIISNNLSNFICFNKYFRRFEN